MSTAWLAAVVVVTPLVLVLARPPLARHRPVP